MPAKTTDTQARANATALRDEAASAREPTVMSRRVAEEAPVAIATAEALAALYVVDETAWLEAMADAVRRGSPEGLDLRNLGEYLTDMAQRDRREVKSRLVVLLAHLLKWAAQPAKRTRSWRTTVLNQRQELVDLAGGGVLRNHAGAVLPEAYDNAVELAAAETGLVKSSLPAACPYTLEQLFTIELTDGKDV